MERISLKVILDDDHVGKTLAIRAVLEKRGLEVTDCLPEIGVIFGTAEEEKVEELRHVEGVAEARREVIYHVPPIDSDVPH